ANISYVHRHIELDRRLRRAGPGIAFGEIEDLDEGRRGLCARDGVLAVDDEAGHAVDAEPPGIDVGCHNFGSAYAVCEVAARGRAVDAGAAGTLDQDVEVADVEHPLEVGPEQLGNDLVLAAVLAGPMDQAMRQHGVGRPPDQRELELDARLAAAFGDRLVDLARPVAAAELRAPIVAARTAPGRHVGVEREGPPGHRHVGAAAQRQRALEAALADVAPRADRVRDDVDIDHGESLRLLVRAWN